MKYPGCPADERDLWKYDLTLVWVPGYGDMWRFVKKRRLAILLRYWPLVGIVVAVVAILWSVLG